MKNMIKRDRLTKNIETQISEGDQTIPLLNRHLTTALFLSKLSAQSSRPVRDKISFVVSSAQRREHLLAELKVNLQD